MMKNANGQYQCRKYYRSTSTLLVGVGATIEEARADLKEKKLLYRKTPMTAVGTFNSPGFSRYKDGNRVALRFNPERQGLIFVHPMSSLAIQNTPAQEE